MESAILLDFKDKDGKKLHLSNKVIKDRKDNNFRLGDDDFIMPIELEGDVDSMTEWYRIIGIYKKAGLAITSSSDSNIIARYCVLCSRYRLSIISGDTLKSGVLEQLLRMEDRLLLNPLAKMRHIPMVVKKDKKKEDLNILGFGAV